MTQPLLQFNDKGIYCAAGDFYIDPWRPVDRAVITHAHSDHAYWGHKHYLAHSLSREVLYYRLGEISLETLDYEQETLINGVKVSFYPAGHIIGSAQVRVEYKGEVWVASGDYKLEDDGLSTPFVPVKCHTFISECTFGMPIYKWQPQQKIYDDMNQWWKSNAAEGRTTFIAGYSLGKAQRILQGLDLSIGKVYLHGVIANTNEALERNGIHLPEAQRVTPELVRESARGGLVICPPSAVGSIWMRRFPAVSFGYCSGWMSIRGAKKRRAADRGFVLSDHADWEGLITAIKATECESVCLTHGSTASFSRYLREQGFDAYEANTQYGLEEEENNETILEEKG
ncbi:mRNA 3-end processing factor [Arcticibacter svalbardensis MN12-7]|uniref:mRNA 3-end processing factor n=1 Tax=Arcticibacter svalbardensis MN12-7 TaxID=1150600 RepID=R9GR87_9SPHI|nr:ligase-associated DNA damage response exonuclease [Arcticibacter svalbardensis]EOR94060.1 mRNA 3-end processing factor [Arcticibacter svalbardensis MN12-7]